MSTRLSRCCFVVLLAFASYSHALYETSITQAQQWLSAQQNSDGSWGTTTAEKFILTAEAVDALRASGLRGEAYYQGITWLENHATDNADYQARRVFSLSAHGDDVSAIITALVSAQNSAVSGRDAWGASQEYLQAPLDTAIVLNSLSLLNSAADIQAAIDYLKAVQLSGASNQGWPVALEDQSDAFATAMVVKALVALQSVDASVAAPINNAVSTLAALVNTASPTYLQAHTAHAAYLSGNTGVANPLLSHLSGAQSSDGSWGGRAYDTALVLRALAAADGLDTPANQSDVTIPDANLRAAINSGLGRNRMDTLDRAELLRLTDLNAASLGISDLTGLEWALNLQHLNVSGNQITSLSPINALALQTLDVTGNIIDSDGDGLLDDDEQLYGLDAFSPYSDGDDLTDYQEVCYDGNCNAYDPFPEGGDTDALLADTDGDNVNDDVEIEQGRVPTLNEPVLIVIISTLLN